jgi:hypothetical protein
MAKCVLGIGLSKKFNVAYCYNPFKEGHSTTTATRWNINNVHHR